VSGVGDFNGDGLADLLIGAERADPNGVLSGSTYVVFGKPDAATVELANLGDAGLILHGGALGDASGRSVSGAGDVNGDGLADVLIGAYGTDGDTNGNGVSYVVFGRQAPGVVQLTTGIGSGGFAIQGAAAGDVAGRVVSSAGDVNGDGFADLLVMADQADPNGSASGTGYVVFGKSDSDTVQLGALGDGGFALHGEAPSDHLGLSRATSSSVGDVDGDGLADLIVSSYRHNNDAGVSYIVFSDAMPPASATYRARSGNGDASTTRFGDTGDGSTADTPDGRAWLDFADGSDPIELTSLETLTLFRNAGSFTEAAANVSWQLQSTRAGFNDAVLSLRYLDSELAPGTHESFLQLLFSADGQPPFVVLPSVVDTQRNRISTAIDVDELGFYFIGQAPVPDGIFVDGFESP
jgi:hypothetical protein